MRKKIIASILTLALAIVPIYPVQAADENEEAEAVIYENSYVDIGERTDYYVPASQLPAVQSDDLPASYDSRDYGNVTSAKSQGSFGTCWAFAALGAGESSMLAQGYVDSAEDIDFSEYHFAYFFYNYANDPLGNLIDDYATAECDSYLSVGGNNYYSMFALATWRGAADESIAPYEDVSYSSTLSTDIAFEDVAHMQNAYHLSMQNMSDVKKLIMEYGSVATSVYFDNYTYYNYDTDSYYQNASSISDHAVAIVGWDDDYAVENFLEDCRPSNPGAWLIKNSWGNYLDYFYVSYEDLCLSNEDAFAFIFEPADNYDKNYQYDGAYNVNTVTGYNRDSFANVYTCEGEYKEKIEAVSIAVADANLDYSIQIYKDPDESDPRTGTPLLATPQTGSTTYAGYYTVKLDEDVYVEPGDRFAVVFTLSNIDTSKLNVTVYMDGDMPGSCISFESHTEDNQSYIINSSLNYVTDLYDSYGGTYDYCVRIKAFTSVIDETSEDTDDSTEDTDKPSEDTDDSTEDTDKPSEDTDDTTEDADKPSEDTDDSTEDTDKPSEDTDDTTEDTDKPSEDADDTTEDTDKPSEDTDDTTEDTDKPSEDTDDSTEDTDKPSEDTDDTTADSVTKNGWVLQGGIWYYFNDAGILVTGWQQIGGAWYYFNGTGAMQTGWQQLGGVWYYMNSSGAMLTGWQEINGDWYYFYEDGSMAESTWVGTYYVNSSGVWEEGSGGSSQGYTEGWKLSGGLWWYQNADGTYPVNAWKAIGNAWYYFDSLGWMTTGWVHDGYGWYYTNESGAMATGWISDGGSWYYLAGSGLMATGWINDCGTWYYMNESGAMHTGWLNDGGAWYYLCGSGAMVINTIIDGCVIDGNGLWVQ